MSDTSPDQATRHDPVYDRLAATPEFAQLRSRYRSFVVPATAAFLAWYLLYVVMSNWAADFMNTQVVGNINVALVFGLLQFVTTFGLAWVYAATPTPSSTRWPVRSSRQYRDQVGVDRKAGPEA